MSSFLALLLGFFSVTNYRSDTAEFKHFGDQTQQALILGSRFMGIPRTHGEILQKGRELASRYGLTIYF